MSLPRYAKYKDSSIPWFGLIPTGWEIKRLKDVIAKSESGTSVNSIDNTAVEGERGVLKTSCVYSGTFDYTENKAVVLDEYEFVSCPLAEGTLIVSRMNTPDLVGMAGLVKFAPVGIFLPDRLWQITFASASPSFVHYWTQVDAYRVQVRMACAGASSSMQNLSQGQFGAFRVPYPPIKEQVAIATFLDRETAKIDTLISEQEKLITLLAEKRQATISHAVTKGLNPNAPMKDSGVEWLGEVPKHWSVVPVKRVASVFVPQRNKPQLNEDANGIFWVTMEDMKGTRIVATNSWVSAEACTDAGTRVLRSGAVIASCVGNFGVAAINAADVIINQQLQAYIPKSSEVINTEFLRYHVVNSKSYFESIGTSATLIYVNQQGFNELPLPLPPPDEQSEIVLFLDRELGRLEALASKAKRGIGLLKERRSALISAAVTGKIDVRHAVQLEQLTIQKAA